VDNLPHVRERVGEAHLERADLRHIH
jgi:hypothetical protein